MKGRGEGRWGDPLALATTSAQNRFYARIRADRQARTMRMTIVIDVPDIVGEALKVALGDSEKVLVCPDTIHPGYIGTIVKEKP